MAGLIAGCAAVDEINPFNDTDAAGSGSAGNSSETASSRYRPTPPSSRPQMKPAVSVSAGGSDAPAASTVMPTDTVPTGGVGGSSQVAAVQPSAPISGPAGLIGLNQPAVERHLGAPVIKRESPPAEIWVYDGAECVLNLYFYLNLESQAFETLRYEVVGMGGERPSDNACYDNIVSARG